MKFKVSLLNYKSCVISYLTQISHAIFVEKFYGYLKTVFNFIEGNFTKKFSSITLPQKSIDVNTKIEDIKPGQISWRNLSGLHCKWVKYSNSTSSYIFFTLFLLWAGSIAAPRLYSVSLMWFYWHNPPFKFFSYKNELINAL